jgi:DNA-binding GntR family transcriptional regulator
VTVARVVLREQVKELILARILRGEYRAGQRLVETRIAEELGVSQAPVREALRDLELLRFVESQPFRGASVRAVSPDELAEIYPVRAALEEVAARAAATRLRASDLVRLERELDAMHRAAAEGDLHAQAEHDAAFHRIVVEASGNSILVDVWGSLRVESRTLITALKTGVEGSEVAELHRPILHALRSRDPERSAAAIREHLQLFATLVKGAQT